MKGHKLLTPPQKHFTALSLISETFFNLYGNRVDMKVNTNKITAPNIF